MCFALHLSSVSLLRLALFKTLLWLKKCPVMLTVSKEAIEIVKKNSSCMLIRSELDLFSSQILLSKFCCSTMITRLICLAGMCCMNFRLPTIFIVDHILFCCSELQKMLLGDQYLFIFSFVKLFSVLMQRKIED